MSKAEIQDAIGKGRQELQEGYPKYHGNVEKFFTGHKTPLEEYPIIPGLGVWNGRSEYFSHVGSDYLGIIANGVTQDNQGSYRVITIKDKKSKPFVGVVQHKSLMNGAFLLCKPACASPTARSVVKNLWDRATKGKGKGKSDAGPSCKLPTKKKPTEKTPDAKNPKTKTPKKTKTKTKKTKAKVPKTKGKNKGGKL
jgi:hypothetical protein